MKLGKRDQPDPSTVSPLGETTVIAAPGTDFTLGPASVGYTSGSPQTAYQWYSNDTKDTDTPTLLAGETFDTLKDNKVSGGTYYYYCEMTNADCPDNLVRTGIYTVSVIPGVVSGSFTGRTIFDIAQANDGGVCGGLAARVSYSTDFADTEEQDAADGTPTKTPQPNTPLYSGTQVYTFTPSAAVSNVRFIYVEDASLEAIVSMAAKADYTGNIPAKSPCKAVVVYRPDLMTSLVNVDRDNAVKPDLYVIYNDAPDGAGTDRAVKLTVSLQDCNCCGAATTSAGWLNFLCYNLGANFMLDPFTYKSAAIDAGNDIKGDLYQWGRVADGHEKRNSPNYPTNDNTGEDGAVPDSALDPNGQVLGSHAAFGQFIKNESTIYRYDWRKTQKNNLWGDGSTSENMAKAANDPCPPGWKVPSQLQWASIYDSTTPPNTWTYGDGYKVGLSLYLPSTGKRDYNNGLLANITTQSMYWSSTYTVAVSYGLQFNQSNISVTSEYYRSFGFSIRCVSE